MQYTKKYAIYYKKSSASDWSKKQDYSTTTKVTFKPGTVTTYTIRVKVKDGSGKVVNKDLKLTVKSAVLTNTSTVSATSIGVNKTLTVTCSSTGGTGTKKYRVAYKRSGSDTWYTAQDFSTTTSVKITPKHVDTYTIAVKVKDGSGTIKRTDLTVKVTKVFSITAKASASSVSLGNSVTVTATPSGATGTVQYQFSYMKMGSSSWTTAKSYTTASKFSIKLPSKGNYSIKVTAKDGSGKTSTAYVAVEVK